MSDPDLIPLARDFEAPTREAWLRLVDKTLKGEGFDSLRSRTADGLPIEPLYTEGPASPVRPAFSPDPTRPWDLRALVSHPDPAEANRQVLEALENGAASVLLETKPEALDRALEGVVLDLAPVALGAGWAGPQAAERLAALAKGGPQAPLLFHLDPLSALARLGASPGPVEAEVARAAEAGVRLSEPYPKARLFLASGRVIHEAGGTEAQELGFGLASAAAYARALAEAALPVADAFPRLALGLSADAAYFTTIAKLRAARLLWAKLTAACGAQSPAYIEVRSSRRMLTRLDAWTNMLRLTSAGFGAGLGGADAVVIEPFTAPLGAPTPFARRQARNLQLVLMEEAGLGRVSDPAGGAGFLETLTDGLARAGWAFFQMIEGRGGVVAALSDGSIQDAVGEARATRQAEFAAGAANLIGVTRFPNADRQPPATASEVIADPIGSAGLELASAPGGGRALQPVRWAEPFEQEETGDGR